VTALFTHPAETAAQSQNITLLAHQNVRPLCNGSTAYVHSDGREYEIMGARDGTSIVRITDPSNPVEVGFIPGTTAGIREPEQYQNYIYVVGAGVLATGIQVISMADPDHPVLVNTVTDTQDAENLTVDTARGYLYTTGSFPYTGHPGLHIYSLADPANPARIGTYEPYQIHDISVQGSRGYACDQTTSLVHVLDLTNPVIPVELATFATPYGLAHTANPTPDGRYLAVTDERDVLNPGGTMGRPLIYDIQNLSKITLVFSFDDVTEAITHFPTLRGNFIYVAHYTAGVHVYDITDPLHPVKVAYYDTWPGDDNLFTGTYETSAFPSGTFTAVDEGTGLYIFRLDPAYGLVRGTARVGNKPLVGATVRVLPNGPRTFTTTNGYFGLAPQSGGSVTIECSKFGYATQTATLSVATGSQQTQDFTLAALGTGTLKGVVRRASDQAALPGAAVSLEASTIATATTSMGKYTLSKVPAGNYFLRAEAEQLAPSFASIPLTPMASIATDFGLQPAPIYDDVETDQGWTLADPDDDAIAGRWVRAAPVGTMTSTGGVEQPSEDHTPAPGTICFVTGNAPPGAPDNQESLRGGKTTLTSPVLNLAAIPDPHVSYWLWYYNAGQYFNGPRLSTVTTQISNDGGASWVPVSVFQRWRAPWQEIDFRVKDYIATPSSTVRVRFIAENRFPGDPVEVLIDDFMVFAGPLGGSSLEAALPQAAPPDPHGILSRVGSMSRVGGGDRTWAFTLAQPADVRVQIMDVQGRLVRGISSGALPAGDHVVRWDGRMTSGSLAASGVYWLRVVAGQDVRSAKFVLTR
jgi:choice-of-anchor B domain-containing protein